MYDAPRMSAAKKPLLVAPIPLTEVPLTAAFLTDAQVAKLGLDPATANKVLADASAVYSRVHGNPYTTRDQLVKWANEQWSDEAELDAVSRLNAALEFLQGAGKLVALHVSSG